MATPAAKKKLLMGEFTFRLVKQEDSCSGCLGVVVLSIETDEGVVGEVYSEFPWSVTPGSHPEGPHYQVLWGSRDSAGKVIEMPSLETPTCYLASRLAQHSRQAHVS